MTILCFWFVLCRWLNNDNSVRNNQKASFMKNEQTTKRMGTIAAKAMRTGKATPSQIRSMGACIITQRPDRSPKRK